MAPSIEADICSAKGCTAAADWALVWRNPRIHTAERRKIWLACDDHKATLSDFLGSRGFLIEVVEHDGSVQPS